MSGTHFAELQQKLAADLSQSCQLNNNLRSEHLSPTIFVERRHDTQHNDNKNNTTHSKIADCCYAGII
jgi:hypothetical protein